MYNTPVRIDSTIVASRLKMARENKGYSKVEVAKALNIATSSMTYYEQGKAVPSIDKLYALADYYGVTIEDVDALNKIEVAKFALTSPFLNKFFVNRFYLNRIKENYTSEETKQAMTEVVKTRQEIESMYTKMLEETDLKLKDGQNNMVVRRVRGVN